MAGILGEATVCDLGQNRKRIGNEDVSSKETAHSFVGGDPISEGDCHEHD
jgi:hypothetical protein